MTLLPVSSGDPHVPAHNAERDAINALQTTIVDKMDKPKIPREGDVLRYDGTKWDTYQSRFFEGTGAPNGAVAAPIGSEYVDRAATNGAVKWTKAGDDGGNTGWLLTSGDTGFRNISPLIDIRSNGVVYTAILRRVGDFVDLYLDLKNPTNTASPWTVLTLPVGFRPGFDRYGALQDNSEAAAQSSAVLATGVVNLYTLTSGKRDRYQGQWSTRDTWPTALPGSVT